MPIRTGVSEDPKGDPSKLLPSQPEPGVPGEDVEPLLPKGRKHAAPAAPGQTAQTPADRRGLERGGRKQDKK
jgi:hypothetical protein